MQCISIDRYQECYTYDSWNFPNITRPFSIIYYALGGNAYYTFEGVEKSFLKDHLYIFPANKKFSLKEKTGEKFYSLYIHAYTWPEVDTVIDIDVTKDDFLKHTLSLMRKYSEEKNDIYIRNLTGMMLSYIFEIFDEAYPLLPVEIKKYIDLHYIAVFGGDDLSKCFNYSKSHISKVFKEKYNLTPKQYAKQLVLKEIVLMLHKGIYVSEISEKLDFSSPENLSRFFKKSFGYSPSEYKKRFKSYFVLIRRFKVNNNINSETIKEAENKLKEISELIFDKDKIIEFNAKYQAFRKEHFDLILKAVDEILSDEEYIRLCSLMYYFMKKGLSIDEFKPVEDGSLKSEFALMPPLIANMAHVSDDAERRGVKREILTATFNEVDYLIDKNIIITGRKGTSRYHYWLPRYGKGQIFKVGAFQFEFVIHDGADVLSVHIPDGTKLDVAENLSDFCYALEFFKKHYSEYDYKGFICKSWLLSPAIEEIMQRKTNITRFGDMFERFELDWDKSGVLMAVYKKLEIKTPDELCENTSLQRNIKKYLKAGNVFKDYGGFISLERLDKLCKEYL